MTAAAEGRNLAGMYNHIMDVMDGTLHKYAKSKPGTTNLPANRMVKMDKSKQSPQLLVYAICSESSIRVIDSLEEDCVANVRGDSSHENFRGGGGTWARIGTSLAAEAKLLQRPDNQEPPKFNQPHPT